LPPHHRDPFDRLLVAHAIHQPMHLLTADPALRQYSDLVVLI
jgi:PIN domain nuclease of toxin-antitoxin system